MPLIQCWLTFSPSRIYIDKQEWKNAMRCSYTLIKNENVRLETSPLEKNESQFWKLQWKYFFYWNEVPCGKLFCCLLGVFNKKFGIGSMALDKLSHLKIPAVRIIVGNWRGSCASLAEICVAARSWSSAPQTFWSVAWRSNSYRNIFLVALPIRRKEMLASIY